MIFHGGSPYPALGEMISRRPGQYNRFLGTNEFAGSMIDKGYAVVYTRRSAFKSRTGDRQVVLDDGSVLEGKEHQHHLGLLRDWTELARNLIKDRMGRPVARTYWYGRSGGSAPGRMFNYIPGANRDSKGARLFDGFLLDDAAGGLMLPTLRFSRVNGADGVFSLKPDEQDHLIFDEARRADFVPQIDITHGAYDGNVFVGGDYQSIKRENARLLVEKKLGGKSRMYEIAGVSHGDAGAVYPAEGKDENLDLSGLFDALIDALDQWVEKKIEPSPSGVVELPEVACPLGMYYPVKAGAGQTSFAAFLDQPRLSINADTTPLPPGFNEAWLEPIDGSNRLVDMNGNGVRDTRETVTQAWQKRAREGKTNGILSPNERFDKERYASCLVTAASDLFRSNLLSEAATLHYIEEAGRYGTGAPSSRTAPGTVQR
jgi:hypothetical protein